MKRLANFSGGHDARYAIRIHETGGPEKLRWEEVEVGNPGSGCCCAKRRSGLNYIDTYHRSGLYPVPLRAILGVEGAAVVEQVGPEVSDFRVGDRVVYVSATRNGACIPRSAWSSFRMIFPTARRRP